MNLQGPRAACEYNALFSPKSLWRFAMKVGDVMIMGAATVRPDASLAQAAKLMIDYRNQRPSCRGCRRQTDRDRYRT